MALPTFVAAGAEVGSTGAVTPALPTGWAADDLLLLVVESATQHPATAPAGWTEIASSPLSSSATANAAGEACLAVFYRVAVAGDTDPTVADTGNHQIAYTLAYRGVDTTTPIHKEAGTTHASATAVTFPSVTTTLADCLIVNIVGNGTDAGAAQVSGWANANLSGVAERADNNDTPGLGGGVAVADGGLAVAGSSGATTATLATASGQALYTLALAPAAGSGQTLTPGEASSTATAHAATIAASGHAAVTAGEAVSVATAHAAAVAPAGHAALSPGAAASTAAADAASVTPTGHATVTPGEAASPAAGHAATVSGAGHANLLPGEAAHAAAAYGAVASSNARLTPGFAAAGHAAYGPAIAASGHVTATPGRAASTPAADAATVTASGHVTVTAGEAVSMAVAYQAAAGNVVVGSLTPGMAVSMAAAYQPQAGPPPTPPPITTIHVVLDTQAKPPTATGLGWHVEVGWTDETTGIFTLGVSTLSGGDVLAGRFPTPVWTDITAETRDVTIDRGSGDATSQKRQGSFSVTLLDTTGKYNPRNAASPLYGVIAPLRPCRAYYTIDTTLLSEVPAGFSDNGDNTATAYLWRGYVSDVEGPQSKKQSPYSTLQSVDLFELLARVYPVVAETGLTTTGGAVGAILDAVGWTDTSLRNIATGDQVPAFSADGSQSALDLITALIAAEGGSFFIAADGTATYQSYQGDSTLAATITTTNIVRPGVSLDQVSNRAKITRTDQAGTPLGPEQVYVDARSQAKYGTRDVPGTPLSTPYVVSDAQALALATRLVGLYKDPRAPVWQLTIDRDNNADLYHLMLGLDVGDRVSINDPGSGTSGDFSIEGVRHTVSDGAVNHSTTWMLRERPVGVFIIGQSVLSGPDVLAP